MDAEDRAREEASRDVAAARAEITGRRDQVVAEYAERLAALESVAGSLEDGSASAKTVQNRVRQLIGDRTGATSRRAGRTTIGMQVHAATPQKHSSTTTASGAGPAPRAGSALTTSHVATSIGKVMATIDNRVVMLLAQTRESEGHRLARLELSLLLNLRRGLERHQGALPRDVILLGSIHEHVEHARTLLDDLAGGAGGRVARLIEFNRTLVSELVALGGAVSGIKEQVLRAKDALGGGEGRAPDLNVAGQEAVAAFAKLQAELDRRFPRADRSLLDDLLRV